MPPIRGDRTTACWGWFAAVLLVWLPADLLTTVAAVSRYGYAVEANPIMRWLLGHGLVAVAVAHVAVAAVAAWCFARLLVVVRGTDSPSLDRGIGIWLRLLLAVGLLVVLNNAVLVGGPWLGL